MLKNSMLHVIISISWYTTNHQTQYSTDVEFLTLFQNGLLHGIDPPESSHVWVRLALQKRHTEDCALWSD